jgi:hypothetical protein
VAEDSDHSSSDPASGERKWLASMTTHYSAQTLTHTFRLGSTIHDADRRREPEPNDNYTKTL